MIRRISILLVALATALTTTLMTALPVSAAARVSVSSSAGSGAASATGATSLTVSGSGFQSIPRAFGGIYVFFGVVEGGSWRPSQGGASGRTFRYIPDSESKNNAGFQRFVAFPDPRPPMPPTAVRSPPTARGRPHSTSPDRSSTSSAALARPSRWTAARPRAVSSPSAHMA